MTLPVRYELRHIAQAKHNKSLLGEACFPDPCTNGSLKYKDWTATIAFYIALHFIGSYLHKKGFKATFRNHRERNDYLKNVASIKDRAVAKILTKYLGLYKLSRKARYTPCFYHYVRLGDLCSYLQFAFKDLPKILKLPP